MEPLDRATVTDLAEQLLIPIREHLASNPIAPARVLEVLNALACAASFVIEGTNFDRVAINFFKVAVDQQLAAIQEPNPADPANQNTTRQ